MGQTTLSWKYDSTGGDGFRIYRSDSPMNPLALPTPLAEVNISEREYVDSTVIAEETYYYRVGAYQGSEEKISAEIEHVAEVANDPMWNDVLSLLRFEDGNYIDDKGNSWNTSGTVSIGAESFVSTNGYIQSSASQLTTIGNGAVTVEMFVSSQHLENALFSFVKSKSSAGRVFGIRVGPSGETFWLRLEGSSGSGSSAVSWATVAYDIAPNTKHHLAICLGAVVGSNRLCELFLNGVKIYSANINRTSLNCSNVTFGYAYWTKNWNFKGELFSARITAGVRYTDNFTPPPFFPNF